MIQLGPHLLCHILLALPYSAPPPPPQAEHEASVTSVGVSPDGMQVCIGTENHTIGVLEVPSHQYSTLLRGHCGVVNAVAADPKRCEGGGVHPTLLRGHCGVVNAVAADPKRCEGGGPSCFLNQQGPVVGQFNNFA